MKQIYIFGSLNMDLVIRSPYMPVAGETVAGSDFTMNPGGKGANQAAACGRLGGSPIMSGCVGSDLFGDELLDTLKKNSVDVSRVRRTEGSSGIAVIVLSEGDNRIIIDGGANSLAAEDDIERLLADAKEGDIFLTQLENPPRVVGHALKRAKEMGLFTVLNPAPWNDGILPYLGSVDLITPNETELALASGEKDVESGIEKLSKMGIGRVIVTLGGEGYRIFDGEKHTVGSCITVDPGDTFSGALVAELARGEDLADAAKFASLCASIACTRLGAIRSVPTREEVEEWKTNKDPIKNFGEYDADRVTFNEDIHATAIGYEAWARHDLATAKAKAGGRA